jgi:hypothetical protein
LNHLSTNIKSIANLSARLDKLTGQSDRESNNDGNNFWKGKKIIPINEWRKIARTNYAFGHGIEHLRIKEALEYFPDDYSQHLFLLGVPDNVREEAEKWLSDYLDLMEFKRNANYGKIKCFGCLLSPCREEAAIYLGINKVIASALERREHNDIVASSQPIYPCPVYNIFECPYKSKDRREEEEKVNGNINGKEEGDKKEYLNFDIDYLFEMSKVAFQLELAFAKAQSMTESNNTIYEANFETNGVQEIRPGYYGWSIPPLDYPLEEKLAEVKRLSVVPITGAEDVYHALTDKETLNKILKQGLDEEHQKNKDQLLPFFMSIKDNIRMDDLFYGTANYHPITNNKVQSQYTSCSLCGEFANIHCLNCIDNITWLCVDHWRDHGSKHMLT